METFETQSFSSADLQLLKLIKKMDSDYDHGLREFQEAIHYAIFHMFVGGTKNCRKRDAVNYILYLRDLAERLHLIENVMKHPD